MKTLFFLLHLNNAKVPKSYFASDRNNGSSRRRKITAASFDVGNSAALYVECFIHVLLRNSQAETFHIKAPINTCFLIRFLLGFLLGAGYT